MNFKNILTITALFISSLTAFGQEGFLGEIRMFGGNFAPSGWALCDGQSLAISQNTALFSIIGITYGGDGRTYFRLPDLRGRSAVHPGTGGGMTPVHLGEKGGTEGFTLTTNNLPSHSHTGHIKVSEGNGNQFYTTNSYIADSGRVVSQQYTSIPPPIVDSKTIQGLQINNTGGNQSVLKRSPFQGVNYIICVYGVFPSRN
jgi:microcystin-dependent protein